MLGWCQCVPAAEPRARAPHTTRALGCCHSFSSLGPSSFLWAGVLIHHHKTTVLWTGANQALLFVLPAAHLSQRDTAESGDCYCGKPLHLAPSEQEHFLFFRVVYTSLKGINNQRKHCNTRKGMSAFLFQGMEFTFSVRMKLSGVTLACFRF